MYVGGVKSCKRATILPFKRFKALPRLDHPYFHMGHLPLQGCFKEGNGLAAVLHL
jgi:hypothetical protein